MDFKEENQRLLTRAAALGSPEAKSMVFHCFAMVFNGFSMVFLCFSMVLHSFSMVFLSFSMLFFGFASGDPSAAALVSTL